MHTVKDLIELLEEIEAKRKGTKGNPKKVLEYSIETSWEVVDSLYSEWKGAFEYGKIKEKQ